jgi:hypothetical protein
MLLYLAAKDYELHMREDLYSFLKNRTTTDRTYNKGVPQVGSGEM